MGQACCTCCQARSLVYWFAGALMPECVTADGKLAGAAVLGSGFDFAAELEYQPGAYEWICIRVYAQLSSHPALVLLKC